MNDFDDVEWEKLYYIWHHAIEANKELRAWPEYFTSSDVHQIKLWFMPNVLNITIPELARYFDNLSDRLYNALKRRCPQLTCIWEGLYEISLLG